MFYLHVSVYSSVLYFPLGVMAVLGIPSQTEAYVMLEIAGSKSVQQINNNIAKTGFLTKKGKRHEASCIYLNTTDIHPRLLMLISLPQKTCRQA